MRKDRLSIDDPRLTAYVLDELQEPQRTEFETELAKSPELQSALEELRQAAAQVFAALQSESAIALTDEQLERIRTAAYSAPSSPITAVAGSAGHPSARVGVNSNRGGAPFSPRIASSAIVLAGLVLTTAALVLTAHFPGPDRGESMLALARHNSEWGAINESLAQAEAPMSTTFAEEVAALRGPRLVYDELRQVYRVDIPDNGRVEGHYVGFLSASALNESASAAEETTEESLALQELGETASGQEFFYDRYGLPDAGLDTAFGTNGVLVVEDADGDGRLDDEALWYAPAGQQRAVTAGEPADAIPEWMVTGNRNFTPATRPGVVTSEMEAVPASGRQAGESDGAEQSGREVAKPVVVVPMTALAAYEKAIDSRRRLLRSVESVEMDRMHFFADQSDGLGGIGGGGQVIDAPVAVPQAEAAGATAELESLRGLVEESRSRARAATPVEAPLPDSSTVTGRYRFSRGGELSDEAAPTDAFSADVSRERLMGAERNAQGRVDQLRTGTASELFREGQVDGEQLPAEYRRRLELLVRQQQAVHSGIAANEVPAQYSEALSELMEAKESEIAEREAEIQRWRGYYRALQSETDALNEEVRHWGRDHQLNESVELAFRQHNFDLGVPDFGGFAYTPGTESYAPIVENDFRSTLVEPVSTFSIDVDTGSYANCVRFINAGKWPPADAVRVEELVNSFDYTDPVPADEHPIAVNFDVAACPWQPEHRLVRIGVRAADIIRSERPPTRLVFLIDVSGSMKDDNKLPLVRQSMHLLVEELGENDRVAIVTYADEAAIRLDPTSGEERETILSAVDALGAGGSTNGEGGLRMAYDVAERQFEVEANNRVILCSDGDFNVGETDDSALVKLIEEKRESGVFLNTYGFGIGNLEDAKLEQIANNGNGEYGYINSLDEAKNIFVHNLTGTLYTVAKDVKLQVDFNPAQVESYRLIGYENRALENADFDNDVVDAGDVGAGHSVSALYQMAPRSPSEDTDPVDLTQASLDRFLRLSKNVESNVRLDLDGTVLNIDGTVVSEERSRQTREFVTAFLARPALEGVEVRNNLKVVADDELPPAGDDLLRLRVRYKRPHQDEGRQFEAVLVDDGTMQSPSDDFQWSSAVASYGMLLRQSHFRGDTTFDAIIETAEAAVGDDPTGRRREFIDLVQRSRALYAKQTGQTSPEPVEFTSAEARERATCSGKYSDLLDKLEVPEDLDSYGAFRDYGYWSGETYRTHTGLLPGYWVYVYPHWYIWGESK